jgi:exopolysaccharide production protein ExoY
MCEISGTRKADPTDLEPVGGRVKRLVDIILAIVGVAILIPLFSFCAVGILLSSGGSVITRHRRVGFGGRHFDCLRFNTMAADDSKWSDRNFRVTSSVNREPEDAKNLRDAPQVTPFGVILRKGGLEDLPNLFNVLKGEMSIVGPRPITDDEIRLYGHRISAYLACRPGLTGLWQITTPGKTGSTEPVMFERIYAQKWSLMLDAKILMLSSFVGSDDAR